MINDTDILTGEILESFGFKAYGSDILHRPKYRIEPRKSDTMHYPYWIEVILSPKYKETNPNSGILSIHSPETKASAIPRDLYKKENWTPEDIERAANYTVTLREWTTPIAWNVTRVGRLKALYSSLTGIDLEENAPGAPSASSVPNAPVA